MPHADRFWQQFKLIRSLCERFGLGDSIYEQAGALFISLHERKAEPKLVDRGRKGRLGAGVCVLVASRRSGAAAPLGLADLASALDESVLGFGKYWGLLQRSASDIFDAAPYESGVLLERYLAECIGPVLQAQRVVLEDERGVLGLARDLREIGHLAWLDVGRRPEHYHLACLFLTLDSVLFSPGRSRGQAWGKPQKMQACAMYNMSYRTVEQRRDELLRLLLKEGAGRLPWALDEKNILVHLADVVRVLLAADSFEPNPPAFDAATARRGSMQERVERAKRRLGGERAAGEELSELDLAVERLLLQAVAEDTITGCKTAKQLYSLLRRLDIDETV